MDLRPTSRSLCAAHDTMSRRIARILHPHSQQKEPIPTRQKPHPSQDDSLRFFHTINDDHHHLSLTFPINVQSLGVTVCRCAYPAFLRFCILRTIEYLFHPHNQTQTIDSSPTDTLPQILSHKFSLTELTEIINLLV